MGKGFFDSPSSAALQPETPLGIGIFSSLLPSGNQEEGGLGGGSGLTPECSPFGTLLSLSQLQAGFMRPPQPANLPAEDPA